MEKLSAGPQLVLDSRIMIDKSAAKKIIKAAYESKEKSIIGSNIFFIRQAVSSHQIRLNMAQRHPKNGAKTPKYGAKTPDRAKYGQNPQSNYAKHE